ncbi:MAG: glucose dehydrogenase [Anaerolineae bacterium]|nr:glucose dehydrogenase [Anaerolineae bacterium]MBT7073680.1 glucose dehydrogenase [Anaerolineae bacterium]MBT7783557.1 glucose dehydrogenase [Anaerolineae bacterium]
MIKKNAMKYLFFGFIVIIALMGCASPLTPVPQLAPVQENSSAPPTEVLSPAPVPTTDSLPEAPISVSSFPEVTEYHWEMIAQGLSQPLDIQNAGDGSNRLFIVERSGKIRIIQNNLILDEPFLDISDKLTDRNSEQGLLGLAFHPHYVKNGFFFVNYTDRKGNTVIARYKVSGNADQANVTSEAVLLRVEQPYSNHNGGGIAFGPDGYLYIGLGDGGSGDDPHGNGQNLNTHLGKILRLYIDGNEPYEIPKDNPFLKGEALPEIWAYGLRNPWRFSFDSLTGDLYIGDVGQDIWEEISFLSANSEGGANFGWNYMEGNHIFLQAPPEGFGVIDPIAEYDHDSGCSITGGVVYRGNELAAWQGIYLYGDFCSGIIWGLLYADGDWKSQEIFYTGSLIASFGEDENGEIYFADYDAELIFKLKK